MKKLITLLAAIAFSATTVLPAAAAEPNEMVPVAVQPEAAKPAPVHKAKKAHKAKKVKKATKAKHKTKRAHKRHA